MSALNLFRALPPTASSSRGRNVPCTAQSREYLLPAGDQLAGAVTPVPASFLFDGQFGALQRVELGSGRGQPRERFNHCGGEGNNRLFHAGVLSRLAGRVVGNRAEHLP